MSRDVRLIRSPISVAGMVLTTISAVLFLVVLLADLFGLHTNPYLGIVFFLLLPTLFVVGLILIPFGAWIERRRRRAGKPSSELRWPDFDLNNPVVRRRAVLVFALTMVNIVIVSLAAYRGVEYMDSPQFCGQVCHTVMRPEFTAYQAGPHARVACVECHVGGGASSFAKAKMSGVHRVIAVATHKYQTPIPEPVHDLRPARDTCEQCHWPEKLHGDLLRRITEYGDDEKNTPSVTVLNVHVGGGSKRLGIASGIHWHMNVANQIEYIATDDKRQVISYVWLRDQNGNEREYVTPGVTAEQLAKGDRRRMDCMDCHNRPSHAIAPTPERAVNERMAAGEIPTSLPFIHREAVRALKVEYPSTAAAVEGISRSLFAFYESRDAGVGAASTADVDKAVRAVQNIWRRNVFPEMKVGFGTYRNNIGHIDFPGCFRCHDDEHTSKDGKKIGQDCETCHSVQS
jgi:nitrate/TMAO reductase-like tetraheme cytochrome c subunit